MEQKQKTLPQSGPVYGEQITREGSVAWSWFLASFVIGLAWVPTVQASGSRLVMPVVMDVVSLGVGLVAFLAARRVSKPAMLWLIPSIGWGVITTVLKVWRLTLNPGLGF